MSQVTLAQQYLFFSETKSPKRLAFYSTAVFEIAGNIHVERLESCFQILIQAHEILRQKYRSEGFQVSTVTSNEFHFKIKSHNSNEPLEEIIKQITVPFDLRNLPLIRVYIINNSKRKYLLIQLPHINSDGWSLNVITRHLKDLYQGLSISRFPFQSFKDAQSIYLGSKTFEKDQSFWGTKTSDLPPFPNKEKPIHESTTIGYFIPQEIVKTIINRKSIFTPFQVFLFASLYLQFKVTGNPEVFLNFSVHNRNYEIYSPGIDFGQIVGLIVNRVFITQQLTSHSIQFADLQQLQANLMKVLKHHRYPYERMMMSLNPTQRKNLPGFYFNFIENEVEITLDKDTTLKRLDFFKEPEPLDLAIDVRQLGNRIYTFIASNGVYSTSSCESFKIELNTLLKEIIEVSDANTSLEVSK